MSNLDLINTDNKGIASLRLHPGQTKAWDSDARFTFVIAGTQSGKTSFCLGLGGFITKFARMAQVITSPLQRHTIYLN